MIIDIATAVILLASVFGTVTGKAAAQKRRFWPAWCLCGALLGPFALLFVLLAPSLEPCPSCGRNIRVKPGRPCRHCSWTPSVKAVHAAPDLRETLGFRLGDTAARVERRLRKAGTPFERTSETMIHCAERETFGHPAGVSIELDGGRADRVRVSYPVDRDYKIYYDLKAALVSKYGKPDHENFDGGHTDSWTAKKFQVSLSTTLLIDKAAPSNAPSTIVIYQRPGAKPEKNFAAAHTAETGPEKQG